MKIRLSLIAAMLFSLALSAFGALSKEYADFPKGPAGLLMTSEERAQWKNVKSDDAAKQFLDLFWARRDPTPGTAVNEFHDLINERIKVADGNFREPNKLGSNTDRGKVFILLGSPTKIVRSGTGAHVSTIQSPGQISHPGSQSAAGGNTAAGSASETSASPAPENPSSAQDYSPKELWRYDQGQVKLTLGQPIVEVAFIDQYSTSDYKMERMLGTDYRSVFDRVAKSYVAQPDLTSVPVYSAEAAPAPMAAPAASTPMATPTTAAAATTTFTSDVLRAAIDEARAAKAGSNTIYLNYGEFVTAEGEHFVPVQLYAPKSAGIAAESGVTFFGAVDTEGGQRVAVYEEPATLQASNGDVYFARSLDLAPGTYRGTFGLAKDGKPVAVVSKPLVVKGVDKSAPGVSSLLLANNIFAMTEAQKPTEPFSFGGLKVVPKGDLVFHQSEDLWYFYEARNPGLDATTNQPNMTMKVSVKGTTDDGKPVKMLGPSAPVQAQELKGVPGHWAVGQALPLGGFKPGSYTITVNVTDAALNKTYDLQESFKVVQ
jgi:GWxTD domain-containing protein